MSSSLPVEALPLSPRIAVLEAIAPILLEFLDEPEPVPCHTSSYTGALYYKDLLDSPNPYRFARVARMGRATFLALLELLEANGGLRAGRKLCTGEKLLIFLYIMSNKTNVDAQERFQHSGDTISHVMHEVIDAVLAVKKYCYVRPPSTTPEEIASNPKFYPYFKDCIGALDGTHITAIVGADIAARFRNRKGALSQNVLAVCSFDLTFQYVLAGWEGSAHDSRVLDHALTCGFPLPPRKYYLGDAGYAMKTWLLTPYRGTRYHLKEWERANLRPQTKEELFNLRHSSLRNAIERVFGVIKRKFPIVRDMKPYPFKTQAHLVLCSTIIYSYMVRFRDDTLTDPAADELGDPEDNDAVSDREDEEDEEDDEAGEGEEDPDSFTHVDVESPESVAQAVRQRDDMARAMWDDYQAYLADHGYPDVSYFIDV